MVRVDASYLLNLKDKCRSNVPSLTSHKLRKCKAKHGEKCLYLSDLKLDSKPETWAKPFQENRVFSGEGRNAKCAPNERNKKELNLLQDGEEEDKLRNKTHLHLQRKCITHIDDLKSCRRVQFLFMQENFLKRIGHLRHLHHLQELYLHDNQIIRIEGLSHLCHLRKLFLPRNKIGVIEGLPPNLEVLDVREQILPEGDSLLLDPQAFQQLQNTAREYLKHESVYLQTSLTVLDINGNKLSEIGTVGLLKNLMVLRAAKNLLKNLDHVCSVLYQLPNLSDLDLRGNPLTALRGYQLNVIKRGSTSIKILDGREISLETKCSLLNFGGSCKEQRKKTQKPKKEKKQCVFDDLKHNCLFFFNGKIVQEKGETNKSKFVLGALYRPEFEAYLKTRQNATATNEGKDQPPTLLSERTHHEVDDDNHCRSSSDNDNNENDTPRHPRE